MNNKFCNRFYESRLSVNLKSKTCPELCRRIQNLKWLGLSVIACVFLVAAGVTEAQQTKKLPLIGYLGNRSPAEALGLDAFRQGLRDLGYTEGQNIAIEYRYFEGKLERLPELAAELVRLNCDVIVPAGVEAVEAAKSATKTVPIVMAFSGADPVRRGIITDLARPGGNITGLASVNAELAGKRLELLKEIVPKLTRVAILASPTGSQDVAGETLKSAESEARALRLGVHSFLVKAPVDIEAAFQAAHKNRAGGLMVSPGGFVGFHAKPIVELAENNRLPAVYPSLTFVEPGGLIIYAEDRIAHFRRAAWYVDKILKGTKPADLPAERPRKFEFIINLKAAKKIGLTIPQSVLFRTDKVIK